MVKIGNKPIFLHIVENFVTQKFNKFVFCLGHKSETIIDYFLKENKKYIKKINKKKNNIEFIYQKRKIKFTGNLIFTGTKAGTGGRILLSYKKMNFNQDFIMTYGDGLSVNINKLVRFHYKNKAEYFNSCETKTEIWVIKIQIIKLNTLIIVIKNLMFISMVVLLFQKMLSIKSNQTLYIGKKNLFLFYKKEKTFCI